MERRTFAKALRELEKFGFIKITQKGGLYRKRNYFMLSDDWRMVQNQVCKMPLVQVANVTPVEGIKQAFRCAK